MHGYPLEKFKALLQKAKFSDDDFLYILGDVIDRNGDGGVEMLCWLLERPNAQLILGNHEAMLLSCEFIFDEITDESVENFTAEKLELLNAYMQNGGDATLKAFRGLQNSSPDTVSYIFEYLHDAPLYETVMAGGNNFLLVHSGIDNFDKGKKLSQYTAADFLWAWPELTDEYFDDVITIFGHTPTMSYGDQYKGKIIKTKTWIDIDVGAAYGQKPALLCLDDLQEFYTD
ncbi:MAG: metallophosphoesterase [Oscillospiraceae bacterium]